jgi:hypothetical protein
VMTRQAPCLTTDMINEASYTVLAYQNVVLHFTQVTTKTPRIFAELFKRLHASRSFETISQHTAHVCVTVEETGMLWRNVWALRSPQHRTCCTYWPIANDQFHNGHCPPHEEHLIWAYWRADNFRPMSFTVSAWEWVYATNLHRLQRETRER